MEWNKCFLAIPIEFIRLLTGAKVNEGETVNFICELNRPNIHVKWFREGEPLPKGTISSLCLEFDHPLLFLDEHFEIQAKGPLHTLTIRKVDWNDGGEYKCVADGGAKTSATLVVKGKR